MMLPNTGPTSSLMEDLVDLGLAEGDKGEAKAKADNRKGHGYAKSDEEGGDYAGPAGNNDSEYEGVWGDSDIDVGDKAAGHRTNVAVGDDGNYGPDGWAKGRGGAKNEDVDSGKMIPSFMIPTQQEVQEAEAQAQVQAEDDQLEKAWEVVHTYFAEGDDGLNEEGLRGVINAMGFALNTCVEDIANLTVDNQRLSEAVNELTGLLYEAEEEDEAPKKNKLPPWMKGDEGDEDEDEDEDDEGGEGNGMGESRHHRANLYEDTSLNSLLDEIRGIGTEAPAPSKAVDLQARLIEGFEGVIESSADIVGRIVQVIAEDQGIAEDQEPDLYEDDERVQIAQFFQGIAEDAQTYLSRLAEGDVPFKMAEADLGKLFNDMEKGIEAMHTVE